MVLVADDEPLIRTVLETLLRESGYHPTTATDGEEAVDHASTQEFEVALLDVGMPGISGLEVLEWLKGNSPDTSVIMVTAMMDAETAIEAMRLGAYDYIIKPFNVDDVLMRVQRARERRHLIIQARDYQKNLEERVAEQTNQLRRMMTQSVQAIMEEEASEQKTSGQRGENLEILAAIRSFAAKLLRRFGGA